MNTRWLPVLAAVLVASVSGCTCKPDVMKVRPSLGVSPAGLDFGQVKVGQVKQLSLKLEAQTQTAVTISSITVQGGAAAAFKLGTVPTQIDSFGTATVTITFTPPAVAAFTAQVVIASDDPDRGTIKIALAGEGALPKLELTPVCASAQGCTAAVTTMPPSIDFGMEPLSRSTPIDPTKLPTLVVVNAGQVELDVSSIAITGTDRAAFTFASGAVDGGVKLQAAEGFNLPVRFVPTSEQQATYAASVVLTSDDPDRPTVTVPLNGTLKPNAPPTVCANLVRVTPQAVGDPPRDYGSASQWAPLLVPPAGGYDFRATRDVRPNELVQISAISDSADATKCTTDVEDGRNLSYRWTLTGAPAGAMNLALGGQTTAQVQLRPVVTGEYTLDLMVSDQHQGVTNVSLKFAVAVKQDLVAQLEWAGFSGVDLDLHLVRPESTDGGEYSGAFSFFREGTSTKTSGDINGYSVRQKAANPGAAFDFDWGQNGDPDNPTLNVDDVGDGQLVENISLNYPENDARCATASCTYGVFVHYFKDARVASPPACVIDGGVDCNDGDRCSCGATQRCVAALAPAGVAPAGNGKCYEAPRPVVKLFFRGNPLPANVIPLDTLMPVNELYLGAPCQLWHVADIAWPAKTAIGSLPDAGTPPPVVTVIGADGNGRIAAPTTARFGVRAAGSLNCDGDSMQGAINWYTRQP